MTIQEYMKKNNETYRSLSEKFGISHTYLCNVAKGWNVYISEDLARKIKAIAPEIDIGIEYEPKYFLYKGDDIE
jgi:hypothetical protein